MLICLLAAPRCWVRRRSRLARQCPSRPLSEGPLAELHRIQFTLLTYAPADLTGTESPKTVLKQASFTFSKGDLLTCAEADADQSPRTGTRCQRRAEARPNGSSIGNRETIISRESYGALATRRIPISSHEERAPIPPRQTVGPLLLMHGAQSLSGCALSAQISASAAASPGRTCATSTTAFSQATIRRRARMSVVYGRCRGRNILIQLIMRRAGPSYTARNSPSGCNWSPARVHHTLDRCPRHILDGRRDLSSPERCARLSCMTTRHPA